MNIIFIKYNFEEKRLNNVVFMRLSGFFPRCVIFTLFLYFKILEKGFCFYFQNLLYLFGSFLRNIKVHRNNAKSLIIHNSQCVFRDDAHKILQ